MNTRTRRVVLVAAAVATGTAIAATSFASDASAGRGAATGATTSKTLKANQGQVALVQAVPKASMSITIDGDPVKSAVSEGSIVGPLPLAEGTHEIDFTTGSQTTSSTVTVEAGKTSDVVVHRPASVGGAPVVSVYPWPASPLGAGKARVLLAHTATTAPADVQVDGQTVFTDIANGEFAQADVAAGSHQVSLYPAGVKATPLLGPLTVDLKAGTLTSVYAVGNPKDGSMNVIVHTTTIGTSSTGAPTQIDTGSAGLAGSVRVYTFSTH